MMQTMKNWFVIIQIIAMLKIAFVLLVLKMFLAKQINLVKVMVNVPLMIVKLMMIA